MTIIVARIDSHVAPGSSAFVRSSAGQGEQFSLPGSSYLFIIISYKMEPCDHIGDGHAPPTSKLLDFIIISILKNCGLPLSHKSSRSKSVVLIINKDTTGTLLLARTPQVARDLSQQFQHRTVHKTYLALVRAGRSTFPTPQGTIDARLTFDDGRVSVLQDKRKKHLDLSVEALTGWELVASSVRPPGLFFLLSRRLSDPEGGKPIRLSLHFRSLG